MDILWYVLIGLTLCVIVFAITKTALQKHDKQKSQQPVVFDKNTLCIKDKYMYQIELKILSVLNTVKPSAYVVLPKVPLRALLLPDKNKNTYNNLPDVLLDFVVFERQTMRPLLVIDVYDNSYHDEALEEQNPSLTKLLQSLSLPVFGVLVRPNMDFDAFKTTVLQQLEPKKEDDDKTKSQN